MTNDELLEKWKKVLDFESKYLPPMEEKNKINCAKEMEELEGGDLYKSYMVPAIRGKYSNHPMVIEKINDKDYLVSEVNVLECIYEESPNWKSVDKKVRWYFPILEDKSNKSYECLRNIHVFGRGYTDGIYHMTPKYGSSVAG